MKDPRLPNLIIAGAQKSGTTALATLLASHPEIFVSPLKEPHYFADLAGPAERLSNLLMPMRSSYASVQPRGAGRISSLDEYLNLFTGGENFKYRAEASPTNLASPNALPAISRLSPDARIILILRNPYHRSYSGFSYFRSLGSEPARTFVEAIIHELTGQRDNWIYGQRHVYMSRYANQLQRAFEFFPSRQVHIIEFEKLVSDTKTVLNELYEFLEIPSCNTFIPKENSTIIHTNPLLKFIKIAISSRIIRRTIPVKLTGKQIAKIDSMRNRVYRFIDKFGAKPDATLPAESIAYLTPIFEHEIDLIEVLTRKNLSGWRNKN